MSPNDQTDLRRADALRNRERILDAAERMLAHSPSATLADIAAAAGVARSTLHRRFSNRDDLLAALHDRPHDSGPFKDEIHALLERDAKLSGVRVRELIEPLDCDGGKAIVDDYLREVRPLFGRARTHQRTVYRPGEICQWDLWEPSGPVRLEAARQAAGSSTRLVGR